MSSLTTQRKTTHMKVNVGTEREVSYRFRFLRDFILLVKFRALNMKMTFILIFNVIMKVKFNVEGGIPDIVPKLRQHVHENGLKR